MNPLGFSYTVVLYGLEEEIEESLTAALVRLGATVHRLGGGHTPAQCIAAAEQCGAEVIFCGASGAAYRQVLEAAARGRWQAPVVVAARFPDTNAWLDALEAGAFDYCAAPFESMALAWVLESARLRRHTPTGLAWRAA